MRYHGEKVLFLGHHGLLERESGVDRWTDRQTDGNLLSELSFLSANAVTLWSQCGQFLAAYQAWGSHVHST